MIHVLATVNVVEGKRSAFLAEFHEIVPEVQAEDGCIEYGATVDVVTNLPVQVGPREQTVVIVEKWRDLPALENHLMASHMLAYRERIRDLVDNVSLQILEPA